MPNETKQRFLEGLHSRFGQPRRLDRSYSLYEVGGGKATVYVRYSALHKGRKAFFGLRQEDLRRIEGTPAVICFLWDGQDQPLLIPYGEYEDVLGATVPARDGQYKVQAFPQDDGTQLYIAQAGRFNVESHLGWTDLERMIDADSLTHVPELSHPQVQTLLGSIGCAKGHDIWIPPSDRQELDLSLSQPFPCCQALPDRFSKVMDILREIDVIWIHRGTSKIRAMFEVEHSTPIYSGLLRFNDVHLADPTLCATLSVVGREARRATFVRQLSRPTFRLSGLAQVCSFLEYADVYTWHTRVTDQ